MQGINLQARVIVTDGGVLFTSSLSFSKHIDGVVANCRKSMGFVIRSTLNFRTIEPIIILYNSLIRMRFEFSQVVWDPNIRLYLDRVQKG